MGKKKSSGGDGGEYHIVAVRMRVLGSGNLQLELNSFSDIKSQNLIPIAMVSSTNIQPTRLCNFQSQGISLTGQTTEIDETFNISRIIMFIKEVAVEYPM